MRWTLLLALCLLLLPVAGEASVVPQQNQEGRFTLVTGMSRTFTMTVYKQEPIRPVTLDIVLERTGAVVGLHVTSPVCSDPDVTMYSLTRTTYVATVRCGYLGVGKYPFTVSLDYGAAQGVFRSTTAHLR